MNDIRSKFKIFGLSLCIISLYLYGFLMTKNDKNIININNLSQEFISNYFTNVEELDKDNKENILIVTSLNDIKNNYGATKIVEAPNHQYYLQYETKEEKNNAFNNFKKEDTLVEENIVYTTSETDNSYNSWGVTSIGLDKAILSVDNNSSKLNVKVAIIDSGCNMTLFNQSFSGRIVEGYNLYDGNTMYDDYGHGTHIAGTIAESTANNVYIVPFKVGNSNSMYNTDIINAINYIALYEKADVINMSFGSAYPSTSIENAIKAANQKNIISVGASGNSGSSSFFYPASYDEVISIGAVDSEYNKASFSNYGSKIDFVAPGVNILSINGLMSGTSMATPHAVSAIATLKSYYDYSLDEIKDLLKYNAIDLGQKGRDNDYGYGLINFNDVTLCDDDNPCSPKEVYYNEKKDITKISVDDVVSTTKNYGNITNLINTTKIKLYYNNTEYEEYYLADLAALEVSNYDAYKVGEQVVNIKYNDLTCNMIVNHNDSFIAQDNFGYNYTLDNNEITITEFIGITDNIKKIIIPDIIDSNNVVALGDNLFKDISFNHITSIVLPSNILSIGRYCFTGTSLNNIDILNTNIKILDYAFYGLSDIKSINSNITYLGDYAFYNCYSLEDITLDNNITSIGSYAFYNCSSLSNVTLNSNITTIGSYAFYNTLISNIVIPNKITEIYEGTFANCPNIVSLTLNEGLLRIDDESFTNTNITNLNIPSTVTYISDTAFLGSSSLETIKVNTNNKVFDTVSNVNSIINKDTKKFILGSSDSIIPDYVTEISTYAFYKNIKLEGLNIPNKVTKIGDYAFDGCDALTILILPSSITYLNNYKQFIGIYLYVYNDSYAHTYAKNYKLKYYCLDPYDVIVNTNSTYKTFTTVNTDNNFYILLKYEDGKNEVINSDYEITYNNNQDSFRYGDTNYFIKVTNDYGLKLNLSINVVVTKSTPSYTIPNNLTGNVNQTLADITLPTNFYWMDDSTILEEAGNKNYKAKYVPSDTTNYETVLNIDIPVNVIKVKGVVVPDIIVNDKEYDGTTNLNINNINIRNLDTNDYEIISSSLSSSEIGNVDSHITIRLSDEYYDNYTFINNLQEKEFIVSSNVVQKKLIKPTKVDKIYTYNGENQELLLNNFIKDKMNITTNSYINAGNYNIEVSLINSNYIWSDNTTDNINFTFTINKAIPTYDLPNNLVGKYNNQLNSVTLPNNFIWDNEEEYLDNVGNNTYKAKYIVNDNYEIVNDIMININVYKYIVSYYNNDNIDNDLVIDTNYTIKDNNINRVGYSFIGWNTIENGSGITYNESNNIELDNDLKLYAMWEKDTIILANSYILNNNYFDYIKDKTVFNNYQQNITINNKYYLTSYKNNNLLSNNDYIGTGTITRIKDNNGNIVMEVVNIVRGDCNGDGIISALDYVTIKNHIMKTNLINNNSYLLGADANNDSSISALDYVKIKNYIMNGVN